MEDCSLHPLDLTIVRQFVEALNEGQTAWNGSPWERAVIERARAGYGKAKDSEENGAIAVEFGLAQLLAAAQPSFYQRGLSLTAWEARIDRGLGMLIRPPSRLFSEAGLDITAARAMPIRLDLSRGMMAGAFVPHSLMDQFSEYFDLKFERIVKRMVHAELDAMAMMTSMVEAVKYARANGYGLLEAVDVITPSAPESLPPTARIFEVDPKRIDPNLKKRIELASRTPKQPGRLSRMFRRGQ